MRKAIVCMGSILLLMLFTGNTYAQGASSESVKDLQRMIMEARKAHESKDFEKAIVLLEKLLVKMPNAALEYNLACAYALSNKPEKALDHLKKSVHQGFLNTNHIENDSDLVSLRKLPRYAEIIKEAKTILEARKKALANMPAPKDIILKAKGLKEGQKAPLLIFLHGMGSSPQELAPVLDVLRTDFTLFIPCGTVKMGMRKDGKPAYNWNPATDLKGILKKAKDIKDIASDQVYIAGFSAGAVMAFAIAIEDPDFLSGCIAFGGAAQKQLLPIEKMKLASKKVPIKIVHGAQDNRMPIALAKDALDYFKKAGFRVEMKEFQGGHSLPQDYVETIKETVKWFKEKPKAE